MKPNDIVAGRVGKRKINRIILTLINTNLLFYLAVGLTGPIVAIFYSDRVNGGSVALAGLAVATFWVVKSAVQVPVSLYADRHPGEADDYGLMVAGFTLAALVPFCYYLFVTEAWQVLLIEAANGAAYGLCVPTYLAIFTRHIDHRRENFEWTLQSNAVGLGYAAAAAVGGLMAERFGFRVLFLVASAIMFLAPVALLFIREDLVGSAGSRAAVGGGTVSKN
ncbi:MAG: MFS transporter [bacterium]